MKNTTTNTVDGFKFKDDTRAEAYKKATELLIQLQVFNQHYGINLITGNCIDKAKHLNSACINKEAIDKNVVAMHEL